MSGGLAIGLPGVVRSPLGPEGSIYVGGEEWSARSADELPLPRGQAVRVVGVDGLTAIVEPDPSSSTPQP